MALPKTLDLSYCSIGDERLALIQLLGKIHGTDTMRKLNLQGTEVTDGGLAYIKGLIGLRVLMLNKTGVTDAGVAHLAAMHDLRTLGLAETRVTDAGLEHLKAFGKLRVLFLGHTQVTDAGLRHLAGLAKLELLSLEYSGVTDAGAGTPQRSEETQVRVRRRYRGDRGRWPTAGGVVAKSRRVFLNRTLKAVRPRHPGRSGFPA